MTDRFADRDALASKIAWEGGIFEALDYGIKTQDMPEGDTDLEEAWADLVVKYRAADEAADKVKELLPELPMM